MGARARRSVECCGRPSLIEASGNCLTPPPELSNTRIEKWRSEGSGLDAKPFEFLNPSILQFLTSSRSRLAVDGAVLPGAAGHHFRLQLSQQGILRRRCGAAYGRQLPAVSG